MAGLYIHIPFCKSRCIYCGFYSTTHTNLKQKYVDSLCCEIKLRAEEILNSKNKKNLGSFVNDKLLIDTIYFGGGTPSQLEEKQLVQLFNNIYNEFAISPTAEITIECNPDDITVDYSKVLSNLPINRVSLGVQTFNEEQLKFIRRRHDKNAIFYAVERLRQAGIGNISIDLMYGFPGETIDDWEYDIKNALSLNIEHISAYSLMYEEGTPLHHLLKQGIIKETDEDDSYNMYNILTDRLTEAGYDHYEISNFAINGFHSRHNSSYWEGIPYIGIGASAHSYDIHTRQWNVSDVETYINSIENGCIPMEFELIDEDTRYNDSITTCLRTSKGLDISILSDKHRKFCLDCAADFIKQGYVEIINNRLRITKNGLFISDMIMSELMFV
jgi:oxygen-independent coproporphyrinogen-3 oxidase